MRVVFRVDASEDIGHGHFFRCLTLAEAFHERDARIEFISRALPGNLLPCIEGRGYKLHDLSERSEKKSESSGHGCKEPFHPLEASIDQDCIETTDVLRHLGGADLLVVDQYSIACSWETEIRRYVRVLAAIDDEPVRRHCAKVLVVPGSCRNPSYCRTFLPKGGELLAGPNYALLRPEFRKMRASKASEQECRKTTENIFVAFGGSSQIELYAAVIKALDFSKFSGKWKIDLVLGGTGQDNSTLRQVLASAKNPIKIFQFSHDISRLMAKADIGIGAAGTMAWERCCLGLPSIAVVLADNQRAIAKDLSEHNAALAIGTAQELTRKPEELSFALDRLRDDGILRRQMSAAGLRLIDGRGVNRVVDSIMRRLEYDGG